MSAAGGNQDMHRARDRSGARTCRACGCTDACACVDLFGEPCHWAEDDLCSACILEPAPYRGSFRAGPHRARAAFAGSGAIGVTRGAA